MLHLYASNAANSTMRILRGLNYREKTSFSSENKIIFYENMTHRIAILMEALSNKSHDLLFTHLLGFLTNLLRYETLRNIKK